ncbi:hypothetical protein RDABS01_039109 [Bienertia sinuspersici]
MGFTFSTTSSQLQHQLPLIPSNSTTPNVKCNLQTPYTNKWVALPSLSPSFSYNTISYKQSHKQIDPIIPWTSAIARHCQNGNLSSAIKEFTQMLLSGIQPNHITFITLLSATPHYHLAASIHGYARKLGLDRPNVKLGTALLHMYSKSGLLGLARRVFDELFEKNSMTWNTMIDAYMRNDNIGDALQLFDEMPVGVRDTVTWTVLIGGFVRKGLDYIALECFCEMQSSGVQPDYVTIIAVLSACANLGALSLGLWVNRFIMGKNFKDNIRMNNTLIDMYSRCGRVDFSRQIFENMPSRSVVSWNSMVGGFAANGCVEEALEFFQMMQREGFKPDGVSFTGALTACSHAGYVDQGLYYFDDMKRVYNIWPRIEHYGCLVDLYSRAGRDVGLAEMVMNFLLEVDPGSDSNYVMLANMHAAIGSWEGAVGMYGLDTFQKLQYQNFEAIPTLMSC